MDERGIEVSNIRLYTWEEFDLDSKKIAKWAESRSFMNVYGILRGGNFLATFLSYHLDIPLLCLCEVDRIGKNTLVVDDLVDQGDTLILLEKRLGFMSTIATLFYVKGAKRMPDFVVHERTEWIQFPWETGETSKYDGTFRKFLEAHPVYQP